MQPSYHCVANIGDADPMVHGGAFVIVDKTGVYDPSLLILDVEECGWNHEEADFDYKYKLSEIVLDRLTVITDEKGTWKGVSDNKFHVNTTTWFGDRKSLDEVAACAGQTFDTFVSSLLSSNPVTRASAYQGIASYYGPENFGNPRELTKEKAEKLCDAMLKQIEETETWHQGYF